jgi:hypothetical protein
MGSVAKIDRLPSANSLEALRTLQDAWDHVEVYQQVANSYKIASKVCYQLLLLCGIGITLLSILDLTGYLVISSRIPIIALSFFETAVASYITFMNPAMRWQQLRMAAMSIESNIWLFRTRSGPYRSDHEAFDQSPEKYLAEVLKEIKTSVLEGADVKATAFFSQATSRNLHGQHASPNAGFGVLDSYTRTSIAHAAADKQQSSRLSRSGYARSSPLSFFLSTTAWCWWLTGRRPDRRSAASTGNASSAAVFGARKVFISGAAATAENDAATAAGAGAGSGTINGKIDDRFGVEDGARGYTDMIDPTTAAGSASGLLLNSNTIDTSPQPAPRTKDRVGSVRLRLDGSTSSCTPSSPSEVVRLEDVIATLHRYDPENEHEVGDSHYEPVQPDTYIRFRVVAALQFYKARIPKCNRTRNIAQSLLVLGSIGAGAVSFAGVPVWAAVVSVMSLAVSAYIEFQGTNSKISRYSFTVHALQEIIIWWQTLPQIDRSVVSNIDRLVLSCEELLQREQQAWRSISQTVRMLQKKAKEEAYDNGSGLRGADRV